MSWISNLFRRGSCDGEPSLRLDTAQLFTTLLTNQRTIMSALDDLNAKADKTAADFATLKGKTDILLQGTADLKTQVAALQAQIAAGGTVSDADLAAVGAKLQAIDDAVNAEGAAEDAAGGAASTGTGAAASGSAT